MPSSAESSTHAGGAEENALKIVPSVLIDHYADACCTSRLNFSAANVVESKIKTAGADHIATAKPFAKYGIVIDGSPCQGFSAANCSNRSDWDKRNDLIRIAAETAVTLEAGYSVKENSPQILKMTRPGDSLPILYELVRYYHEHEYQVSIHALGAIFWGASNENPCLRRCTKGRSLPKYVLPTHKVISGRRMTKQHLCPSTSTAAVRSRVQTLEKGYSYDGNDRLKMPVTAKDALLPWENRKLGDKKSIRRTRPRRGREMLTLLGMS